MKVYILAFSIVLSACASVQPVGQGQGQQLDVKAAINQAHEILEPMLNESSSAEWKCGLPTWGDIRSTKGPRGVALTGWVLPCSISTKDNSGVYADAQTFVFLFIDQKLRRAAKVLGTGTLSKQQVVYDN
ncbi:MAG: hypothetical protein ABI846_07950 [Rudaea sp.]